MASGSKIESFADVATAKNGLKTRNRDLNAAKSVLLALIATFENCVRPEHFCAVSRKSASIIKSREKKKTNKRRKKLGFFLVDSTHLHFTPSRARFLLNLPLLHSSLRCGIKAGNPLFKNIHTCNSSHSKVEPAQPVV